jgi:hypothetical protein
LATWSPFSFAIQAALIEELCCIGKFAKKSGASVLRFRWRFLLISGSVAVIFSSTASPPASLANFHFGVTSAPGGTEPNFSSKALFFDAARSVAS